MKKELEEAKLISIPEPKDERQTFFFGRDAGSDGFLWDRDFDHIANISGTWILRYWFDNRTCHFSSACPCPDFSLFFF